jgi:hypothetical protein
MNLGKMFIEIDMTDYKFLSHHLPEEIKKSYKIPYSGLLALRPRIKRVLQNMK